MMTSSPASSSGKPYRGHLHVNPIVTDAPSVGESSASRWRNLPKREMRFARPKLESRPRTSESDDEEESNSIKNTVELKEPPPVVYIDIPEESRSNVCDDTRQQRVPTDFDQVNEETIFYDPYNDRIITTPRDGSESVQEDRTSRNPAHSQQSSSSTLTSNQSKENQCFGSRQVQSPVNTSVPTFMSNQVDIYNRHQTTTPQDEFHLTPLPVTEFREPPPPYSEINRTPTATSPISDQYTNTIVVEQQRTRVITPLSKHRKLVTCHHCGHRVHTLVIRSIGAITHVIAFMFIIFFFPLVYLVYCTDLCKYRKHYCPTCNSMIGYEVPIVCQKMVYVTKSNN